MQAYKSFEYVTSIYRETCVSAGEMIAVYVYKEVPKYATDIERFRERKIKTMNVHGTHRG